MSIQVGDKAPDFTLPSTRDDKITLSEILKDRAVVLTFYLLDFTGDEGRG